MCVSGGVCGMCKVECVCGVCEVECVRWSVWCVCEVVCV